VDRYSTDTYPSLAIAVDPHPEIGRIGILPDAGNIYTWAKPAIDPRIPDQPVAFAPPRISCLTSTISVSQTISLVITWVSPG
jgi:hypothetical protein